MEILSNEPVQEHLATPLPTTEDADQDRIAETNKADLLRFLSALAPEGNLTFQTFAESENAKKARYLHSKILHGSLAKHHKTLTSMNQKGAGIFVMVNQGDGKGRKEQNVRKVRALFVDLDGAPLKPVEDALIPPSIVVETSPNRYHAYWLVRDMPINAFKAAQKALAEKFNGDTKVCDLPRVMRLPAFLHHKQTKPYCSKLLKCESEMVWPWHALASGLSLPMPIALPDKIPEGERNSTLFNLAIAAAKRGVPEDSERIYLKTINEERCVPPLTDSELSTLVCSAYKYREEPDRWGIPWKLIDDPRFVALKPGPKLLLLMLYQRTQTSSTLAFPILWKDFKKHFPRNTTFKEYRMALVKSELIVLTRKGFGANGAFTTKANMYRMAVT